MTEFRYYLSLFIRRLPLFLPVTTVLAAVSVIVAMALPPAYVSETRLVAQAPQIPAELAPSTVQVPPVERLQIIRQRLMTRENLLDIARQLGVLPGIEEMTADAIVGAMRARTSVNISAGRGRATIMTMSFQAPAARISAEVVGEYLTRVQQEDAEFRRGRAGETLEFFENQVDGLRQDLDALSNEILTFKNENSGALPESLDFRMSQREEARNSLDRVARDIERLEDNRERLKALYENTGTVAEAPDAPPPTREEARLEELRLRLDERLGVYSEEAPQVRTLRARIERLENKVAEQDAAAAAESAAAAAEGAAAAEAAPPNELELRLSEIDSELSRLRERRDALEKRIAELDASIEKTPEVANQLQKLNREYSGLEQEFSAAQDRLNAARTGELVETRSRGQRLSVIEPPAVPSQPTKPNRMLIAGGGSAFAVFVGLGLVALLELVNTTARRPEDLVRRFNVVPLATIPFIRTRGQMLMQRGAKVLLLLAMLVGLPAAVYAVHVYYLPLDLLADKVMNKIGIRL